MPRVTMPDGAVVDMPDELTPELATRLKALRDSASNKAPMPVQGVPNDGALPPALPSDSKPISRVTKAKQFWDSVRAMPNDTPGAIPIKVAMNLYSGFEAPKTAMGEGLNWLGNKLGIQSAEGSAKWKAALASDSADQQANAASIPGGGLIQMVPAMGMGPAGEIGALGLGGKAALGAIEGGRMAGMTPNGGGNFDPVAELKKVGTGAAVGAAVPVAVAGGTKVASKIGNAIKGTLPADAAATQALADQFGVRVFAPDLANSPGLAKTGTLIESVPGSGMVKDRLAQQADALKAAQGLLAKHGISGDTGTTIQQGLANKLAQGKANSTAAYDLVGQLSQGKGDVPLANTLGQIQKFKAEIGASALPDEGLLGLLGKMETRLTNPKAGVDLSYQGVRGLRSDLGNMISDYYKGTNAATGSKGVGILQGVKNGLEDDLGAFTKQNGPQIAQAAKDADSIYRTQVVPYKDKMISGAIKSSEPDQIYNAFIQSGKGDRAQNFYNTLDKDGQAAVRSQMVHNAMDAATSGKQPFSPAKFAQSLEKVKDASGVFFSGSDKMELDGFTNLMRHIQRAGEVMENPPTGQRVIQGVIGAEGVSGLTAAMLGHPGALAPVAASVGAAKAANVMFKTAWGKSFLLAASDLKPGSQAMINLINQYAPKLAGASAGSMAKPNPESETQK